MRIRALTIVVVTEAEDKPPAFTLVGNLTAQEAYMILFDFIQQEARQQGKAESNGKTPEKRRRATQRARSDSEGGSSG